MKFNTKNGLVEITEDGWVSIETIKSRRIIKISPNGSKVNKLILTFNFLKNIMVFFFNKKFLPF